MTGDKVPDRPVPGGSRDDAVAGMPPKPDAEPQPDAEPKPEPDVAADAETDGATGPGPESSDEGAPEESEHADATGTEELAVPASGAVRRRRRRDPLASALIGILTLLLGFAFAVQVRSAGTSQVLAGAREEDLVRILDELNAREERLRGQITEQRTALEQLTNSDSQSATALEEARRRAEAIGILNGTVAAHGPGLRMTVRDPDGAVRVEDVLDAIEELRGAGAETMQIDGVRVGVSTAVTGRPGNLMIDGRPITAPYGFLIIGSPQNMETAMNIPGGVVQRITGLGGSVDITQVKDLVVDALRPLDTPQYASPKTGN